MAPGDVAHVPRTPSPVAGAGPIAKHFRSRARLRRLLVRLRRPTPSTPALRATPGGASLTTFGFVTTVPRYLPKASNSLTFVRGADRACCAPRKWLYCLICAPLKWSCRPTDALPVLAARTPPGGALACALGSGTLPPAQMVMQTDRCLACSGCPHALRRGIGVRTRQRHLAARACCAPRRG